MFVAPALRRGGTGRKLSAAFEKSLAASYIGVFLQTGGRLLADKCYASCDYVTSDMVSMVKRIKV